MFRHLILQKKKKSICTVHKDILIGREEHVTAGIDPEPPPEGQANDKGIQLACAYLRYTHICKSLIGNDIRCLP